MEAGRLPVIGKPPRHGYLLRYRSGILALLILGCTALEGMPDTGQWVLNSGGILVSRNRSAQNRALEGLGTPPHLARMWETDNAVRYEAGSPPSDGECDRREQLDREERSWELLNNLNLNLYPRDKHGAPPPSPPVKPPRKQRQSSP